MQGIVVFSFNDVEGKNKRVEQMRGSACCEFLGKRGGKERSVVSRRKVKRTDTWECRAWSAYLPSSVFVTSKAFLTGPGC
ncbi:hypothetical protein CLOM_g21129 [Closterium sp. NIES-68]|nr:hypothetical protein CLOM_g21129 [Closterium sp. NIES-68]GJP60647.1 hypothetical protein CLOP_g17874 [Closterium sp. NIES-67]GJP69055.1 hypothetical protein CLOP_g25682 [Closterium sp. NIES-67]